MSSIIRCRSGVMGCSWAEGVGAGSPQNHGSGDARPESVAAANHRGCWEGRGTRDDEGEKPPRTWLRRSTWEEGCGSAFIGDVELRRSEGAWSEAGPRTARKPAPQVFTAERFSRVPSMFDSLGVQVPCTT